MKADPITGEVQPELNLTKGSAKLAEALAKAQAEMVQPEKNKTVKVPTKEGRSYTFDYADYSAIVEAVRVPLSKYGICFAHTLELREKELVLITRLIHSSGEFLESVYPLPRSANPKELGGAITYGKRYCLSAITGCVADDDADAEPENVAEFYSRKPQQPLVRNAPTNPPEKAPESPAPAEQPTGVKRARQALSSKLKRVEPAPKAKEEKPAPPVAEAISDDEREVFFGSLKGYQITLMTADNLDAAIKEGYSYIERYPTMKATQKERLNKQLRCLEAARFEKDLDQTPPLGDEDFRE